MRQARFGLILAGLTALGFAAWAPGCLFAPEDCVDLLKCPGAGGSSSTVTASTATSTSTGMSCKTDDQCGASTAGSCMKRVCKDGACTDAVDVANTPNDDGNPCTQEICSEEGIPHPAVPTGGACLGMTGFCDSAGKCFPGCGDDSNCTEGLTPSCNKVTHTCISCSDGIQNGSEVGKDCGGSSCKACNGTACGSNADCLGDACVDGVCCESACTDTCKACNVPGSVGKCTDLPTGQPDPACGNPLSSVCDGQGTCKTAGGLACGKDDVCASNVCFAGICGVQTKGACTEDAMCVSGLCSVGVCTECSTSSQCATMKCSASACKAPGGAPCNLDSDCAGNKCQYNLCRANNNAPCAGNDDCLSGYCNAGSCDKCSPGTCSGNAACGSTFGLFTCELPTNAFCTSYVYCAAVGGMQQCDGFPRKCH
jgi:hypothetical protein